MIQSFSHLCLSLVLVNPLGYQQKRHAVTFVPLVESGYNRRLSTLHIRALFLLLVITAAEYPCNLVPHGLLALLLAHLSLERLLLP